MKLPLLTYAAIIMIRNLVLVITLSSLYLSALAQPSGYTSIGKVTPRHAGEIQASNWSVGAETMDRDYTIYENWKEYLGPLGIKKARLQAGWAKTEYQKGYYNFAWLDSIIYDMAAQGVEPWINVSYGNPLYSGGTRLGAAMPKDSASITAFAAWAKLLAARYKEVVDEYEIWNEGIHSKKNTVEEYANLYITTAEAIRSVQPEAQLLAMAIAGIRPELADSFLAEMQRRNKLHLVDQITYHPYRQNPDEVYEQVLKLRAVVNRYDPRITIRQGENGAPSQYRRTKALREYPWTETSQSKWALRRMLGDLGRDIETSYFSIVDLNYPDEINRKGTLESDTTKKVVKAKPVYYALQHLAAIFDNTLARVPNYPYTTSADSSLSLFTYQHQATGQQVITLWLDGHVPSDSEEYQTIDLSVSAGHFNEVVWVDLRTGEVFEIPDSAIQRTGTHYTFTDIPIYDSPILIADKSLIPLTSPSSSK
ncbi:MAG: hypothetical protein ACFB15_18140 [Cyclobacteriaceae bacterium]